MTMESPLKPLFIHRFSPTKCSGRSDGDLSGTSFEALMLLSRVSQTAIAWGVGCTDI